MSTKLLVTGYIKTIISIKEIINIIYKYQMPTDEWNTQYITDNNNNIKFDKSKTFINIIEDKPITMYSKQSIKSGDIFTWKIQIKSLICDSFSSNPYVGIIIDNKRNLKNQLNDSSFDECGYQYCGGSGYLFCVDWMNKKFSNYKNFNKLFNKKNDIIEIILDLTEFTIKIKINENQEIVAFENIQNKPYRLALSVNKCAGSVFRFL